MDSVWITMNAAVKMNTLDHFATRHVLSKISLVTVYSQTILLCVLDTEFVQLKILVFVSQDIKVNFVIFGNVLDFLKLLIEYAVDTGNALRRMFAIVTADGLEMSVMKELRQLKN